MGEIATNLGALFTADFWAMGGHAFFVWTAYAVTVIVLGAVTAASIAVTRRRERELAALDPDRAARRGGAATRAQATEDA